jgi:hypothetical protein
MAAWESGPAVLDAKEWQYNTTALTCGADGGSPRRHGEHGEENNHTAEDGEDAEKNNQ